MSEELDKLDAQSATEIMKYTLSDDRFWEDDRNIVAQIGEPDPEDWIPQWQPTRNISQAWELLEKMNWEWYRVDCFEGKWKAGEVEVCGDENYIDNDIEADTAPLAIVLAALKSKGISYE